MTLATQKPPSPSSEDLCGLGTNRGESTSCFLTTADIQEKEVRALVGSDVELSCVFPGSQTFDLNDLYVYWQISVVGGPKTVVTYYLSGNSSAGHRDNRYKDRARLSLERMMRGDFSLRLYNITPQDEQKFHCLVFRKSLELKEILDVVVTLHVAGKTAAADGTQLTPASVPEEVSLRPPLGSFTRVFHRERPSLCPQGSVQ